MISIVVVINKVSSVLLQMDVCTFSTKKKLCDVFWSDLAYDFWNMAIFFKTAQPLNEYINPTFLCV